MIAGLAKWSIENDRRNPNIQPNKLIVKSSQALA
jgi:hypothetical protein